MQALRGSPSPLSRPRLARLTLRADSATHGASHGSVHKEVLKLTPATYAYLLANTREPAVLGACRDATATVHGANMQVPPEQGALLGVLVELLGATRVLEVGTFTGYSALAFALALPADGVVVTCDRNAETMAIAQRFWEEAGMGHKIEPKLGPALETLDGLLAQGCAPFDICFIDADKRAYGEYFTRAMQLVRVGGLIAVDNTLWYGRPADPAVDDKQTVAIREFNARVLADERVTHAMVPIGDGLTLLRRRV